MKRIELFEKANRENLKEFGVNIKVLIAYWSSMDAENDMIDFDGVIWDKEIEDIAKCMNDNGITEFTISSTFSSLTETLAGFEKNGFKVVGLTEINTRYTDFDGNRKKSPAILMKKGGN